MTSGASAPSASASSTPLMTSESCWVTPEIVAHAAFTFTSLRMFCATPRSVKMGSALVLAITPATAVPCPW